MRTTARRRTGTIISRSIAIGIAVGLLGCQAASPAPAVESVGTLAPSYNSIAVAPLKHDAPPEMGGVADTGDDAPAPSSLDVLRQEAAAAGTVDASKKIDGVTTGAVR